MTDIIDPRSRPNGVHCIITPTEGSPLVYTQPSGCLSPVAVGSVCGPEPLVARVGDVLDNRFIGKVAVPQLADGTGLK